MFDIKKTSIFAILFFLVSYPLFSQADESTNHFLTVQWFGQSAIKITTSDNKTILIDPFITNNPTTPDNYKDLTSLGKIDLILVTHGHNDHLGDTSTLLKSCNCKLIAPSGLEDNLAFVGLVDSKRLIHMNKSGTYALTKNLKITMVHAEHSSEFDWFNPSTQQHQLLYGGEPVGYIIQFDNKFTIYHMGDTGLFSDMEFIGQYYRPDLILIPIGGNYTMDPHDAAYATSNWLKPTYALPIHYGTFPALKGTPEEYQKLMTFNKTTVLHLIPGDSKTFNF